MIKDQSNTISRRKAVQLIGGVALIAAAPFPIAAVQKLSDERDGKNIYYAYRSFWPELETTSTFKKMGVNTRCFSTLR